MTKKFNLKNEPIPDWLKKGYLNLLNPIIQMAIRFDLNPNTFTIIGFILSCIAAGFMALGHIRMAAGMILLAGIFDTIDGKLARASNKVTRFGALFDSTLDRYSEVIFFFGMAFYFIGEKWYWTSVAVAIGLGGSLMVSYVRARAEGLGFKCSVGIMQRAERLILLAFGGLIHLYGLATAIWIIAVMSNFTAIQRIVHVRKEDRKETSSA